MKMPREIDVEITSRCNLRCKYCYYFENPNVEYLDLPTEDWITFFDELGSIGIMEVVLTGGEPFSRPDLKTIIDTIVLNRMRFSILSNGGLITDEIIEYISKTGRCNSIQISLDGSCGEIHDLSRGNGSFEGAMRGLRILLANSIKVDVRFTITHFNVDDIENFTSFILDDIGLPSFSTNAASYFGICRNSGQEIMLNRNDRSKAMKTLLFLNRKYEGRILAAAGPLADALSFARMQKAYDDGCPPFFEGGSLTACGCFNSKLSVRSDGTITPCSMLPHLELGHINSDKIIDIWQNSKKLSFIRERKKIPLNNFPLCQECKFINYCTGGCPGSAYNYTKEVNHPCPDACYKTFLDGNRV